MSKKHKVKVMIAQMQENSQPHFHINQPAYIIFAKSPLLLERLVAQQMQFKFDKSLYPKVAFVKAAYNYTDRAYLHLFQDDDSWIVDINPKTPTGVVEYSEFENEMLAQSARCLIYNQTKDIRELILARAFASTMISSQGDQSSLSEDMNISNALKDWFDRYE